MNVLWKIFNQIYLLGENIHEKILNHQHFQNYYELLVANFHIRLLSARKSKNHFPGLFTYSEIESKIKESFFLLVSFIFKFDLRQRSKYPQYCNEILSLFHRKIPQKFGKLLGSIVANAKRANKVVGRRRLPVVRKVTSLDTTNIKKVISDLPRVHF